MVVWGRESGAIPFPTVYTSTKGLDAEVAVGERTERLTKDLYQFVSVGWW